MNRAMYFAKVTFAIIRLPIYLVLFWLRLPVVWLCGALSTLFLFAWLFSLYAFPNKKEMVWGFGIISFGSFFISWGYDWLLMCIAPHDLEIIKSA